MDLMHMNYRPYTKSWSAKLACARRTSSFRSRMDISSGGASSTYMQSFTSGVYSFGFSASLVQMLECLATLKETGLSVSFHDIRLQIRFHEH